MALLCRLLRCHSELVAYRIILDTFGVFAGLSVFLVLLIVYHNLQGGIWSCVSAVFAAVLAHIHVLQWKDVVYSWYESTELAKIALLGASGQLVSLGGIGAYLVAARVKYDPSKPFAASYYMSVIWCAATFCWSLQLTLQCIFLRRQLPVNVPQQLHPYGIGGLRNATGNWTLFPTPEGPPSPSLKRGPHTACVSNSRRWGTAIRGTGDMHSRPIQQIPPPLALNLPS